MNKEMFEALAQLEEEKGIPMEVMLEKISNAIKAAVRKEYNAVENVEVKMDPEKGKVEVLLLKDVVEEVEDPALQITLEEAHTYNKRAKVGGVVSIRLEPKQFGRIAAQSAISVIRQGVREAERGQLMAEFESKKNEIVSAKVVRIDEKRGNVILEFGKNEAVLPKSEQIEGEDLEPGDLIKVFVAEYEDPEKGVRYKISRRNAGLVRRLFEQEVPEIYDGIVEIKSISREAGSRTKLAVWSADENVDAVGACIGPKGRRVNAIVAELGGEKIDVIRFSEDPEAFVTAALAPANVMSVAVTDEENKICRAVVDESQLSLAIGNRGQNARLAARLTGWKIDIRSMQEMCSE